MWSGDSQKEIPALFLYKKDVCICFAIYGKNDIITNSVKMKEYGK